MSDFSMPATFSRISRSDFRQTRRLNPTSTYLTPVDHFPDTLSDLDLPTVLALHGRACRQLEREYLDSPDGANPATLDRLEALNEELDERQRDLPSLD